MATLQPMVAEPERDKIAFAERFRLALTYANIPDDRRRRKKVSKMFGVSTETVRKWLTGETMPATKRLSEFSEKLNVRGEWLLTGAGDKFKDEEHPTVEPGPAIRGKCPLISWVNAGEFCDVVDNFEPGDAEEWFPCPVPHSSETYVLRVSGDSMTAPYGASFPDGELIFVDPNVSPSNGKFVVVRLDNSKKVTFKKLIIEETGNQYLAALNPSWPEPIIRIDDDEPATICGVVIFRGAPI